MEDVRDDVNYQHLIGLQDNSRCAATNLARKKIQEEEDEEENLEGEMEESEEAMSGAIAEEIASTTENEENGEISEKGEDKIIAIDILNHLDRYCFHVTLLFHLFIHR